MHEDRQAVQFQELLGNRTLDAGAFTACDNECVFGVFQSDARMISKDF